MNQEINEDEVLSDIQSVPASRRSSSASSDMPKTNLRSRPGSIQRDDSFVDRRSSTIDPNDVPSLSKQQAPIKVLVFNGKCSKIFKSTIEDCVEDCILEFPGENSIYVPKSGQHIQIPAGASRNSIISLREQNTSAQQSSRSNPRRSSSINQYNSLQQLGGGARTSLTNSFSLPTADQVGTAATRIRQQKLAFVEDISEETTTPTYETKIQSRRPSLLPDEPNSPAGPNINLSSASVPSFSYHKNPSAKAHMSYRDRQKDYRLSDLVMLGPEYFANVFHLPRSLLSTTPIQPQKSTNPKQRHNKTAEKVSELDRIKQDLFHRYLWTQNPQVSCRIRPLSTYTRSQTFVS